MLKRTIGILLTIALIQSLAYVPQAYATSADVIISHIQPGLPGAATKEYVGIYNNNAHQVLINDWCLRNKSNVAFACFTSRTPGEQVWLPSYGYAVAASEAYVPLPMGATASVRYLPANLSSGSLVGSSDTVSLYDQAGMLRDVYTWTTGVSNGALFHRQLLTTPLATYKNTGHTSDWTNGQLTEYFPTDQLEYQPAEATDVCMNIEGVQIELPEGMEFVDGQECVEIPIVPATPIPVRITELLANPAGADTGKEFIELYNDSDETIDLSGYRVEYGATGEKSFVLPPETVIGAGQYLVLTNATINFTLPNTMGIVRLVDPQTVLAIDQTSIYENAKDDQAWALFDTGWRYTKYATPGAENNEPLVEPVVTVAVASSVKPCAENQYRSPETNRCRLLSTTTTVQTACKENQYRSLETGRCRTIAAATTPTPCKEGQERSAETNRCRTVRALVATDYSVLKAETTTQPDRWYVYAAIAAVVAGLFAYGAWEWRADLRRVAMQLRWPVRRR